MFDCSMVGQEARMASEVAGGGRGCGGKPRTPSPTPIFIDDPIPQAGDMDVDSGSGDGGTQDNGARFMMQTRRMDLMPLGGPRQVAPQGASSSSTGGRGRGKEPVARGAANPRAEPLPPRQPASQPSPPGTGHRAPSSDNPSRSYLPHGMPSPLTQEARWSTSHVEPSQLWGRRS